MIRGNLYGNNEKLNLERKWRENTFFLAVIGKEREKKKERKRDTQYISPMD